MKIKTVLLRKLTFLQRISGLKEYKLLKQKRIDIINQFKKYKNEGNYINISTENLKILKKTILKFMWHQPKEIDIYDKILNAKISKIKYSKVELEENDPILICIVKDDIERIKIMLEHHRKIGIRKFVILDNCSTDGTYEFLLKQNDVDLLRCETKYTTLNREAWINRIILHYGYNKWYLCVDSDELFVYKDCENVKISEYIKKLDSIQNKRVLSLLLDMYSKEGIFKSENKNIINEYCYFDYDTYRREKNYKFETLRGGPRERMFKNINIDNKPKFMLNKYPLFKFEKGDLQGSSHFQFPYKKNYDLKLDSALLHYKFLYSDFEKYLGRAKNGNYSSGSVEYKTYIKAFESGENINFYGKHSKKYIDSNSLFDINIFREE